jgi:hypothetical protein
MVRIPSAMGLTVVGIIQLWANGGVAAQAMGDRYKVIETKESKFQEELDRAAKEGYRLVAGDASIEFGIFERAADGKRRTYTFVRDVDKFLKEKKLQPGFRFVAPAFFADEDWFSGIVEKVEGDELSREYQFVKARSTGALRTRLEAGLETFTVIAVAAGRPGAGALLEKGEQARKATLIDSDVTGTIKKELGDAAARGFCLVDSEGIKQAVYALQECGQGLKPPLYEVIAATKTETLERELNAAAARGMRIVPESVVGIEKRLLFGNAYNNETIAVLRQEADAAPLTYRVVGTMRLSTFATELNAAAADGFTLTAFAIGPKEMVGVLEKK